MAKHTELCRDWVERDRKVISPCSHLSYFPLVVARAEGDTVYDEDGNAYIDFLSSASSLNLGSGHPAVTAAIREQLDRCAQYTIAYTYNRADIEYAERLTSVYPGGIDARVCFGNCGSDGNDAAVKFARAYTGRSKIITFINGYHGSTYGAASLTAVTTRARAGMGPFLPEVYSFPFYDDSIDDETCRRESTRAIEQAFATYLPSDEVAAVIIEPIQGDAGLLPAHPIFLKKLYDLCRANGILFIVEEVQQAFFRTGKWFSIEHYGIVPDGIVLGKFLGAGLPLGAFMARSDIMAALPAPAHVFTLGGCALACAAGIAAFDYMCTPEFRQLLHENTLLMQSCLDELCHAFPDILTGTRGIGMSRGLAITKNGAPDSDGTFKVLFRAYEKGLLVISLAENILRLQPPLNIRPEAMRRGFSILAEAVADYRDGRILDDVLRYRQGW